MKDEAHVTVPLSLPIFASSSSSDYKRLFLLNWENFAAPWFVLKEVFSSSDLARLCNREVFIKTTNNKPQKSLLHQRHWLLCECWLLVIIKLQKCFFVMSLMYCNTVGFERSTGSNFENLENHYTRDNGFFPVVAVDNQKMGLNGLEVEVASWIILLFFLLKLPGKKETKPPFFISVDTWFPAVTSAKPSSLDMQPLQAFLAVVLNQCV